MIKVTSVSGLILVAAALLAMLLVVCSPDSLGTPHLPAHQSSSPSSTKSTSGADTVVPASPSRVSAHTAVVPSRRVSDLSPKRQAWIRKNVEASLDSMIRKVTAMSSPHDTPMDQVEFLKILRQVQIKQAMLRLLDSDGVVIASSAPPKVANSLRLMEWSFVNGRAKLADGSTMEEARLVYDLDLASHPTIVALDQELSVAEKADALDACYQFNSLDDATRRDRFNAHLKLLDQFYGYQEKLRNLDASASDFRATQAYLTDVSQTTWQAMGRLIPGNIVVNPRTLLASPRS